MPNIKSSEQSIKADSKRRSSNSSVKSKIRTAIRRDSDSFDNVDGVKKFFSSISSILDKAVSKGIIHKNTAARKKSRITKKLKT